MTVPTYSVSINKYEATLTYEPDEFGEVLTETKVFWATTGGFDEWVQKQQAGPLTNISWEIIKAGPQQGEPIDDKWLGSELPQE